MCCIFQVCDEPVAYMYDTPGKILGLQPRDN